MGYLTRPMDGMGGPDRDDADHKQLRHARKREEGFPVGRYLQPPPMLFTRDGHNAFLGDMLRGSSVFLVCSGPSLITHNLGKLRRRGLITCAVNNAATIVRPNLWVSVDDPGNFCDAIWRDPAIFKFVPLCHMEKLFTTRDSADQLQASTELVGDMPSVFGFRRNEAFVAEQWLYEDTFNWGNHGQRVDAYGIKGSRSVMLVAVRLLFFLGARRIFLLGCDFRMTFRGTNYAFEQGRSRSSVAGNNASFQALNTRFKHLRPYFEREGLCIFNCTRNSGLTAFPFMEYDEAVNVALAGFPRRMNTEGMYNRRESLQIRKNKTVAPDEIKVQRLVEEQLPTTTLISAIDKNTAGTLGTTWPTWMKFRPWLQRLPATILYDHEMSPDEIPNTLKNAHPCITFVPWRPLALSHSTKRWCHAFLKYPAECIHTPWYLWIEPEAIATQDRHWLRAEWFQPDEDGRETAFVAPTWTYSKPADVLIRLEAWASSIPELSKYPAVDLPMPDKDRVQHSAISTWLFFGRTSWVQQIATLVQDCLPCESSATFATYCAARRRDRIVRWNMKQYGWDHSFGRKDHAGICTQLLSAS